MKHIKTIQTTLFVFYYESKYFLLFSLPAFLKSRTRLFWYRLWIRKDEFHRSLDMDFNFLITANEKQRVEYLNDLTIRREIAHRKGIGEPYEHLLKLLR
jgi:hypothetical protein